MKTIVVMASVILVLFGLSAGASWYMRQHQAEHAEHADQGETAESLPEKGQKGGPGHGVPPSSPTELRSAVKPSFNPEVDAAAQLANNLRNQTEALKTREQQLITRQKNLEMISQDIRGERAVIDDMRKQLSEELNALTEKIESLERKAGEVDTKKKQLTQERKQLSESVVRVEESEKENVKRLSGVYDSMDAEAAAQLLQHMSDTGKIETAAKILTGMKERQAAKVLASFPDRTTVVQLLEKMRAVDRSPSQSKSDSGVSLTGGN